MPELQISDCKVTTAGTGVNVVRLNVTSGVGVFAVEIKGPAVVQRTISDTVHIREVPLGLRVYGISESLVHKATSIFPEPPSLIEQCTITLVSPGSQQLLDIVVLQDAEWQALANSFPEGVGTASVRTL